MTNETTPKPRKSTAKRLPTPKQERFAKVYAATGNASQAYREAYDTESMNPDTVHRNAYQLTQKPHIKALVGVEKMLINERMASEVAIDRNKITSMLLEGAKIADREGQAGAFVQAAMGLGKLHGLITDKTESINRTSHELTREQLETIAKQAIVSSPEPAESPPKPEEPWEKSMKSAH